MAASDPLSGEKSTFILPFQMFIRFSSIALTTGARSSSPAWVRPPNRIMASGELKATKLASALPRISPV